MQTCKTMMAVLVLALLLIPVPEARALDAFAGAWVADMPATREYRTLPKEEKAEFERYLSEKGFTEGLFTVLAGMSFSVDVAQRTLSVLYKGQSFFTSTYTIRAPKENAGQVQKGVTIALLDNTRELKMSTRLVFSQKEGTPRVYLFVWDYLQVVLKRQ